MATRTRGAGTTALAAPAAEAVTLSDEGGTAAPAEERTSARQKPMLVDLLLAEIKPWPHLNPREHFDETELDQLAASMRADYERGGPGVLEPILVHRTAGDTWSEGLIVAGNRRWLAAQRAGLPTIPCLVREYTEAEALDIAIVENAQRSDLTPIEEARGYKRWLDAEPGRTQQQLAERIGISQPVIANRIRLLDLPPEAQHLVDVGAITVGAARDYLLPFSGIHEKARAKLFAKVVKQLAPEDDEVHPTAEVFRTVATEASQLSRSLEPGGYGREELLFDPKLHAECGCGAPEFRYYAYSDRKTRRCFNVEWYEAQQTAARDAAAAARDEARQKAQQTAKKVADQPVLSSAKFHEIYKQGEYETIADGKGKFQYGILLDPARLAPESLLVVKDNLGNHALVCTKVGSVRAAKGQAGKELKKRVDALRKRRLEEDLAAAANFQLDPWVVVELLAGLEAYGEHKVRAVAQELGIEVGGYGGRPKTRSLPIDKVLAAAKVYAFRSKRGDYDGYGDPIEKEVHQQLEREWEPQLQALLPAAAAETKGRAGKAKKVPASEVETLAQQADLRFQHLHEAMLQVEVAHREELGAEAVAAARDTLQRRTDALKEFLVEHHAVCVTEATDAPGEVVYSVGNQRLLEGAEEILQETEPVQAAEAA